MIKLPELRSISRSEQGFTLVEILVAIVITALIGSAVAVSTSQVFHIDAVSMNHQIAITQVENAVHYISRDAQQAQQIIPMDSLNVALPQDWDVINNKVLETISFDLINGDPDDPADAGHKLQIEWTDWDNNTNKVTYLVVNGTLQKTTIINEGAPSTIRIADSISQAAGTWNPTGKILILGTLQTTIGTGTTQRQETRTFQIIPRSAR